MKNCLKCWVMVAVGIFLVWIVFANNVVGSTGMFRGLLESFNLRPAPSAWCPDGVGANFGSTCGDIQDVSIKTFAENKMSPEQCALGSSYSGSGGCVILSEAQKRMIQTRGGNRTMEASDNSF